MSTVSDDRDNLIHPEVRAEQGRLFDDPAAEEAVESTIVEIVDTERPEALTTPERTPRKLRRAVGALVAGVTLVSGLLIFTKDDGKASRIESPRTDTQDPPTTLESLEPVDQDYRQVGEQTFEFTPVYATDETIQEVVDQIYTNFELAHEQREPRYLAYYLEDINSTYGVELTTSIGNLKNYYPVDVRRDVVPGSERKNADGSWSVQITREIDAPVFDGEPEVRQLKLVIKDFVVPDKTSPDGYAPKPSWVISEDYPIEP